MPRLPQSDEYSPDDLEGEDFSESFANLEVFGPSAAMQSGLWSKAHGRECINFEDGFHEDPDLADVPIAEAPSDGWLRRLTKLRAAEFRCGRCGVRSKQNPTLLEVHHPDRDKTTDDPRHLIVLCVSCHADMPGHAFIRDKRPAASFTAIDELRRQQGISPPKDWP